MTTTYSKRMTEERYTQRQFDAALRTKVREAIAPWPVIDTVHQVIIGGLTAEPHLVTISVIDGQGCMTTRAREIQDAFAEALGYAMRSGWNFWLHDDVPMAFRVPFAEMVATAPDEVTA